MAIGQELLNVPMGDMIRQMALAIADGQMALDASSIGVAEMMGGLKAVFDDDGNQTFDDSRIFFGYDLMSPEDALIYIEADNALSGGDTTALTKLINDQKTAIASNTKLSKDEKDHPLIRVPTRLSMLELGFTPTFYQFVDTIIEVKIAIKITRETTRTRTTKDTFQQNTNASRSRSGFLGLFLGPSSRQTTTVSTSQVDGSYSAKYGYSAEGASLLRTKLVPLPPPPVLEDRIRRQLDEDVERRRRLLDAKLPKPA